MVDSRIEDLYRKIIERNYTYVNKVENTPYSPEIAVIKLLSIQITKGKQENILSELDRITGIDPKFEYLIYEGQIVANQFHDRSNWKKIKNLSEKAVSLGAVPVFSLMYLGKIYENQSKYGDAVNCYLKIIQKFPFAIIARTNGSYLLASKLKSYTEAKKIILEGGKNWINWINHKSVLIMQYKLGIPLMLGFTLLFWLINSYPLAYILLVASLGFFIWSLQYRQRFIMGITRWSIILGLWVLILLHNPISLSQITSGFAFIGNLNKPVPTYLASPIERINLEDLIITTSDLPSSISWNKPIVVHVIVQDAGLDGKNAIEALFSPVTNDFAGLMQSVLRFSSNSLAEDYYKKPVSTDVHGYSPQDWNFNNIYADQSRITCDSNFGTNLKAPLTCIWVARYGQIVVKFQAFLNTDAYILESMQETIERIDKKITQALINNE